MFVERQRDRERERMVMRVQRGSEVRRRRQCVRVCASRGSGSRAQPNKRVRPTAVATTTPASVSGKRASPLEAGGTLQGDRALGKDAAASTKKANAGNAAAADAGTGGEKAWSDARWVKGRWDYSQFKAASGETDWDAVLDAEVARRRALEENPTPSIMEDPVNFDTSEVPWWVWVRRYHLPEAELVNGRAAMIGYALGYAVDALTGHGLVDQSSGFLGKTLIFATVLGVCLVRKMDDIKTFQGLADEATFYDKQWQATWDGHDRPSETEQ